MYVVVPIYYRNDMISIYKQLSKITWRESIGFLGLAATEVAIGVIGISMLSQHGAAYYSISSLIIEVLLVVVSMFIFTRGARTWRRVLGAFLLSIGAYMLTTKTKSGNII